MMLDFTSKKQVDISEEDKLVIIISRSSANILLGILAMSENRLPMNDADFDYFNKASGEIIGAIWTAKENKE